MAETRYTDRTDGVGVKLGLLQQAYAAGQLDLALSLADSLKDTLRCERQWRNREPALVGAESFAEVGALPQAWAHWARGWSWYKTIALRETAGLGRSGELVAAAVAFREEQAGDLRREVRVARVEGRTRRLVPSQIGSEVCADGVRQCRVMFAADVPAGGQAEYLLFYGNPWAELPEYPTDLRVSGEGYDLEIENRHYRARLSRQTGQLERLVYKRAQGLELFAGGEGHGEPPHIDWAHDYLADEKFQKFRVTNWEACPNYEVSRGPVCVQVRRWGFPHSPVHPLFTPSRMHIDVEYTFCAGLPWFFKEGRMEMVQDFAIDYLRDDEWVFSGYSFTDSVWMDQRGRVHEGAVAAGQEEDLWGVGFFNRYSRDAFIALWLEHSAQGFAGLHHTGVPQLDYQGHGQLWSRWAAHSGPRFKAGDLLKQRNAYLLAPYEGPGPVEEARRRLCEPLRVEAGGALRADGAAAEGFLARPGEETPGLKPAVWEALHQAKDDMFYTADANVVDMGYVYDVRVRDGLVHVLMTMPHRGRPCYRYLAETCSAPVRRHLLQVAGVREVLVDFTWEPAWSLARLTRAGRGAMGLEA